MRRSFFLFPLLLAACAPVPPIAPTPRKLTGTGMDMFAPIAMRLHPLTRIAPPSAPTTAPAQTPRAPTQSPGATAPGYTLEARFEFTDQFGDTTKGPGTLTLILFDQPNPLIHKGDRLASWSLPLNSPESHRDHWDRTTRTYLFKLPLPPSLPTHKTLLEATFTLPNGTTLTDDLELPPK